MDSDDEWLPSKLEEQVKFHQKNRDIFISYTDELWIRDGISIKIPKKFQKIGKDSFVENISYCNIAPSSVLVHKKVFESVGLFDESLEVCEDYDLWLRIALIFDIGLVDKKLIKKYAGHEEQLSFKHWGMDRFRVRTLEKILKELNREEQRYSLVKNELIKKYELLLKGALKYDKKKEIQIYRHPNPLKTKFQELSNRIIYIPPIID